MQARLTDSIDSLDGLRKLIDGATSNPGSLLVYSNELMSRFVVFSKGQELQADACAVRLLDSAFADKKKLAEVIRTYTKSLPPPEAAAASASRSFKRCIGADGDPDGWINRCRAVDQALADRAPLSNGCSRSEHFYAAGRGLRFHFRKPSVLVFHHLARCNLRARHAPRSYFLGIDTSTSIFSRFATRSTELGC